MTFAALNSPVNVPACFEIGWEIRNKSVKKGTGEEKTQPGGYRSECYFFLYHFNIFLYNKYVGDTISART